jgi:hypothetical protein
MPASLRPKSATPAEAPMTPPKISSAPPSLMPSRLPTISLIMPPNSGIVPKASIAFFWDSFWSFSCWESS